MGFSSVMATGIMVIVLVAGMGSLFVLNSSGISKMKVTMHEQERKTEERAMTDISLINASYSTVTKVTEAYAINYGENTLDIALLHAYMDGKSVESANLTVMHASDPERRIWAMNEIVVMNVTGTLISGNHALKITTEDGDSASFIVMVS